MALSNIDVHERAAERVRGLCHYGCQVDVNPAIPIRRYYRSGLEMIRMANIFYEEGNIENAFILYSKFITLFVEKLANHPDIKLVSPQDKKVNREKVKEAFKRAESLKPKLREKFENEEIKHQKKLHKEAEELAKQQERQRQEKQKRKQEEEASLELAKRLQEEEEEEARRYQEEQYRKLQEQERNKLNKQREEEERIRYGMAGMTVGPVAPAISSAPASEPVAWQPSAPNAPESYPSVLPAPPSYSAATGQTVPPVPSRDLKPKLSSPTAPFAANDSLPMIDRSSKPEAFDHFMSTGSVTGNVFGLRSVIVPAELMVKFIKLALPNTNKNVETLGLLCGTMSRGAFRVTHLVIPRQSGTPDSCNMEGEEEIFDLQDKHDLITLGWIHTHPTQTAFLSSVDLHTHFPYQQMLPEAIAIVCAPKYQETGCFYLTPDYGLKTIGNCREKGFHYHPKEPPLFDECSHVQYEQGGSVQVVDLRK